MNRLKSIKEAEIWLEKNDITIETKVKNEKIFWSAYQINGDSRKWICNGSNSRDYYEYEEQIMFTVNLIRECLRLKKGEN